ncbi:MAG: hypothetical protein SLRJCFUN_001976 [Candidatus Fervidibacter sp.]
MLKGLLLVLTIVAGGIALAMWFRRRRYAATNFVKDPDPFTIPKPQRVDTAIATLEQLLEETDDPVIREALQNRLEQLKAERERWRKQGGQMGR